jgi:hypothetical protein
MYFISLYRKTRFKVLSLWTNIVTVGGNITYGANTKNAAQNAFLNTRR